MELTIEFELIVPDMEFNSCWLVTFKCTKQVMELTIEFELIVPDMEFNNCWLVTFKCNMLLVIM
jgi:hypothetical protein